MSNGSRTRRTDPVQVVTTARPSLTDDVGSRTRRYLWMMGIRTTCFVAAVAVPGWPRWVLAAGAVFLPYVAVVVANAGREPNRDTPVPVVPDARRALPAATATVGDRPPDHRNPSAADPVV